MSDCQNCLSPGCECFRCKLRPISVPQTTSRIATLEAQLAAQRAIVKADDVLFVDELRLKLEAVKPTSNTDVLETILEKISNDTTACRQTRKAAKQLDKETTDAT